MYEAATRVGGENLYLHTLSILASKLQYFSLWMMIPLMSVLNAVVGCSYRMSWRILVSLYIIQALGVHGDILSGFGIWRLIVFDGGSPQLRTGIASTDGSVV